MAHHAFISYSTEDKTTAGAVCARLEMDGVRCWMSPRDIDAGADWNTAIIEAISASRVMVLVWSSNSNASPDVILEAKHAFRQGIPVIPFRIEDTPPPKSLEYYLAFVQWLDAFTPPLEEHLQRLSERVQAVLERTADTNTKEGEEPLLAGAPAPILPTQNEGRKIRHGWILSLIITAGLLTLVFTIFWWREKARIAQASPTPTPADKLPFKVEYPVVDGKWVYKGWDPERLLKRPVVERLKMEDQLRDFMKLDPNSTLPSAEWHVMHGDREIPSQINVRTVTLTQDRTLSCSSCHKRFDILDRDTPRSTCAECHVMN